MGRAQPSQSLAPPAVRKQQRAKAAKVIINKTIPALLNSDARARKGVERAELIVFSEADLGGAAGSDPVTSKAADRNARKHRRGEKGSRGANSVETTDSSEPRRGNKKPVGVGDSRNNVDGDINAQSKPKAKARSKRQGSTSSELSAEDIASESANGTEPRLQPRASAKPTFVIQVTDTLTAAHALSTSQPSNKNIAILNMASSLRPGGGVLNGATSQEESLCTRTTLLPSLKDEWYRLPELGGIWTPDVLCFRLGGGAGAGSEGNGIEGRELSRSERFHVDVISAGMVRDPDLALRKSGEVIGYANKRDRELVLSKMEAVVAILRRKKTEKVILGAWGCGAYGNPVTEVAAAWKKVLTEGAEGAHILKHVVFAIKERSMAEQFASAWGDGIELEEPRENGQRKADDDLDELHRAELEIKIKELEEQMAHTKFEVTRDRLASVVDGLKVQLGQVGNGRAVDDESDPGQSNEEDSSAEETDEPVDSDEESED